MVLKSTSIHILELKQEKEKEKNKKKKQKKKTFIVLQSPLFLCEVVFVPGFSSRRLVILMFYPDKSMAHYFIYSLPVSINALFACYMPLLTIQVIVFNILNQERSRFRKDKRCSRFKKNAKFPFLRYPVNQYKSVLRHTCVIPPTSCYQ